MPRLTRRPLLIAPLLLAACGGEEKAPVRRDFPPLRYAYLPPIDLNVQRIELPGGYVAATGDEEIINESPIDPVDTLFALARDRLKPVGTAGAATFHIINASINRHRDTLKGELAVRLEVHDADETNTGFAEARVTATRTGVIADERASVYDMLKSMMDDMNVELEYQIRNKLRSWVVEPREPAPQPVDPSEKLPPPPPFVPPPKGM